ncbi:unnamed protein product [Ceratitis capitata]|uniref:(Mediterranean fruit fly) hypothetical protein n=1 Tax=Ceratitis capitata TaxID=7213 RepID=A0A811UC17_CERCA|nr:unnamed protein product [Ceratitis capitata]
MGIELNSNSSYTRSDDTEILTFLESPCQMDIPIRRLSKSEVFEEIVRFIKCKSPE